MHIQPLKDNFVIFLWHINVEGFKNTAFIRKWLQPNEKNHVIICKVLLLLFLRNLPFWCKNTSANNSRKTATSNRNDKKQNTASISCLHMEFTDCLTSKNIIKPWSSYLQLEYHIRNNNSKIFETCHVSSHLILVMLSNY